MKYVATIKNVWGLTEKDVGKPVVKDGNLVGYVASVSPEFIFVEVEKDAIEDEPKSVSIEITKEE